MLRTLFGKSLRDQRAGILGWGLGLGAMAVLLLTNYNRVLQNPALSLDAYWESFPEAMRAFFGNVASITTLSGFLRVEILAYLPLLLALFTVGHASAALVGEEERGILDLVLAQPVPRWRLLLERFLAVAVGTLAICVLIGLSFVLGARIGDVEADLLPLFLAPVSAFLPLLLFEALTFLAGSLVHRRRYVNLVAALAVVGSYFLNGLAQLIEPLKPWRPLSPFYHYERIDVLGGQVEAGAILFFLTLTLLFLALSLFSFERKDLTG